jgi:hypothetical protein
VRENLSDKKKVSARKWQYFAEKKMLGNSFQVLFKERKNLEKQGREKDCSSNKGKDGANSI